MCSFDVLMSLPFRSLGCRPRLFQSHVAVATVSRGGAEPAGGGEVNPGEHGRPGMKMKAEARLSLPVHIMYLQTARQSGQTSEEDYNSVCVSLKYLGFEFFCSHLVHLSVTP